MRWRGRGILLAFLGLLSTFGVCGFAAPAGAQAELVDTYTYGGVGDYYALLPLVSLPSLDYNEEEISPDGQWVIEGSLNPNPTNPYYLVHIVQNTDGSPSIGGITSLYSEADITSAETTYGITPFGSTAPANGEPAVGSCGYSAPTAENTEGTVVGTTYYQPPSGSAPYPLCGGFVYSQATGTELLSNLMGNANFFAYRAQAIANNGWIVGDGQTQNNENVAYLAYPAELPTVTSVSPAVGSTTGGTTVTIEGSNFNTNPNSTSFLFGGNAAIYGGGTDATDVQCATTFTCTAVVPSGPSGTYDVYASTGVGYSLADAPDDQYTYVSPPVIDSVDPVGGPLGGGNDVTITGSGFENPALTFQGVLFDPESDSSGTFAGALSGVDATVVSDTEIDVTAPDATAAAPPGAPSFFADLTANFVATSDPTQSVNSVTDVVGQNSYGFGYPIISSVDPEVGALDGGDGVVITGTGFQDPGLDLSDVSFDPVGDTGGSKAFTTTDATVVSDTEIDVTTPDATAAADGALSLDTDVSADFSDGIGGDVDSIVQHDGDNFYSFGAPVIDSIDPAGGALDGGNLVTITGSGFENSLLTFQGVSFDPEGDSDGSQAFDAEVARVVSDTEIDVTIPDGTDAADGAQFMDTLVTIQFTDEGGNQIDSYPAATDDNSYEFGAPVIDAVVPGGGPLTGGNTITLTGSGFAASDLSLDDVSFDPVDDTDGSEAFTTDDVSVVSDTEIDVTAPDATDAADGAFTLDTAVTADFTDDADNPVSSEVGTPEDNLYTFGAPVIDAVEPGGGPLTGDNTVAIIGSGFESPGLDLSDIEFGPTDDLLGPSPLTTSDATVVSDTEIDVTAPDATAAAAAEDSVTFDSEVTATFTDPDDDVVDSVDATADDNGYAFGAPVIDDIEPGGGPFDGGNTVKIIGSGFDNPDLDLAAVSFDPTGDIDGSLALSAEDATVVSDTEIDVTAPDATAAADGAATVDTVVSATFTDAEDRDVTSVDGSPGDNDYAYGAPVIDSVEPDSGTMYGGDTVKLIGSGFDNPQLSLTGVSFDPTGDTDGALAFTTPEATVVSDTEIDVTSPDATAAADGAATLEAAITAQFTDLDSNTVDSAVGAAGDSEFTFQSPAEVSQAVMFGPGADPTITLIGSGFGPEPPTVAPCKSGGEDYADNDLDFGDLTTDTGAGAPGDCIGLDVTTFSDTEISFGFGAGYASYPPIAPGDQFEVSVNGATYSGTVAFASQSVTFFSPAPADATGGGATYTPVATATSGLTPIVTVDAASASVCTITAGVVSFTGSGTCTLDANQSGNLYYPPALPVQQSFSVVPAPLPQTITFAALAKQRMTASPVTVGAIATSGDAVVFTTSTPAVCSAGGTDGTLITLVGPGRCTVDANQAGDGTYAAAPQVARSFTVTLAPQTITFAALAKQRMTASPVTVGAIATSGDAVVFTTSTPAVCSAGGTDGTLITLVGPGRCTVDANQAGDGTYAAAPQIARSFTVTLAPQTITFAALAKQRMTASPVTVGAIATSGDAVVFTTSTPAVCSAGGTDGTLITLVGPGRCTVDANQAGDGTYAAAPQIARSFTVTLAPQTITFAALAKQRMTASPVTVGAIATSGDAVVFTTSTPAVCSAGGTDGTLITLVGPGRCTVDAKQAGDGTYAAAPQVARSFAVS